MLKTWAARTDSCYLERFFCIFIFTENQHRVYVSKERIKKQVPNIMTISESIEKMKDSSKLNIWVWNKATNNRRKTETKSSTSASITGGVEAGLFTMKGWQQWKTSVCYPSLFLSAHTAKLEHRGQPNVILATVWRHVTMLNCHNHRG